MLIDSFHRHVLLVHRRTPTNPGLVTATAVVSGALGSTLASFSVADTPEPDPAMIGKLRKLRPPSIIALANVNDNRQHLDRSTTTHLHRTAEGISDQVTTSPTMIRRE
jgi:hypothetical protein